MSQGIDNYGLNQHLKYYELELDSLDATVSADSSFSSTDWPQFNIATPIPGLAAIKILEVQIPFSFYTINAFNNTFTLNEYPGGTASGGNPFTITLPVGNYSSSSLPTALEAAFVAAGTASPYTVTYSTLLGTLTFATSGAGGSYFTLGFGQVGDPGSANPRLNLGFGSAGTYTSTTGVSPTMVAPSVANISGPNYLYINSRAIGTQIDVLLPGGAFNLGKGSIGPQMAKIPINVQPGGVIYWSDPGKPSSIPLTIADPQKWFSMGNLALLSQFDMYITVGNNAIPRATALNGLSFSVKLGLLQNVTLSAQSVSAFDNMPGATIIGDKRRRV